MSTTLAKQPTSRRNGHFASSPLMKVAEVKQGNKELSSLPINKEVNSENSANWNYVTDLSDW